MEPTARTCRWRAAAHRERWRCDAPSRLMTLTDSQRRAVEHDGRNLQLIACAGSGRTEVVARRVVHLLTPGKHGSLLPGNIIAFTFTDKAAAELKERIVTRTRQALGEILGMAEMFVGTIHAFRLELLKSASPKHPKIEVLNEVQQGLFVDRNSSKSGLTTSTDLNGAALKRYRDTGHYVTALSILREAERDDAQLDGCSVPNGLAAYQSLLDDKSYLDCSAILEEAVTLLTNDVGVRGRLGERVTYAIVDEYQGVNPVQEAIVWSLHELGARICVIGDDDQTINEWRGSDVENILTSEKRYPAARIDGRNVWHLLPRTGIRGQARFEGTIEDERRLFYVAMTRSQKYLHLTWAPIAGKNNRYAAASEFWNDILASNESVVVREL
jgi:DNA helicase-2/ATP-dependent DNA helicase PcrA